MVQESLSRPPLVHRPQEDGEVATVDPHYVGADDEVGSKYSTHSLTASIYEYRYENGRRYHAYKDGKYAFPNDEAEQDRLDILHHIYLLLFGNKLHLAPIVPNPQKILDVGTGTGIWAIDIAEAYPWAEVIGTDLSPIQPSWVPQNVKFQIDDCENEWTFPEDSFDLIHIRHLNGAIKDWPALIGEAFRTQKPGGWVEMAEYEFFLYTDDDSLPKTSALHRYYDLCNQAATKIGREFKIAAALEPILKATGYVQVHHQIMKIPFGLWPTGKLQKDMGAYLYMTAEKGFESFGLALLTRVVGMSVKEVDALITEAKRESRSQTIHSYSRQHVYWAQKPLDSRSYGWE